jgi:hypothetical protein
MTEPTEKVYLKKFYMAIGIVVRAREKLCEKFGFG